MEELKEMTLQDLFNSLYLALQEGAKLEDKVYIIKDPMRGESELKDVVFESYNHEIRLYNY